MKGDFVSYLVACVLKVGKAAAEIVNARCCRFASVRPAIGSVPSFYRVAQGINQRPGPRIILAFVCFSTVTILRRK
jgi:hypothetical protein